MPIRMSVEPGKGLIRGTIVGDFSLEEIFDAIDGVVEDPDFEPGSNVLTDHRLVGTPLTAFQAEQLVAHLDSLRGSFDGTRWAAVVNQPASRGMMRMVAILAERVPVPVRVFDLMAEAEAWLEVRD